MDNKIRTTNQLLIEIDAVLNTNDEELYKKALRVLRRKLPLNWAKELQTYTEKPLITIYKVMSGERKDSDNSILIRAIEMAKEETDRIEKLALKIKSI